MAELLSPVTVAVLLSPYAGGGQLLSPVAVAVLLSPARRRMAVAAVAGDGGGVVVAAAGAGRAAVAGGGGGVVVAGAGAGPLLSPVTVAVLLLPPVAVAVLLLPVDAWRCCWSPPVADAVLLSPLTNALLWSPPVAVAVLLIALGDRHRTLPSEVAVRGSAFLHPLHTVGRHAHILSVALTVPRLGRCRPWRRGQPHPDTQGDR